MPYKDKEKQREYDRRRYEDNGEVVKERSQRRYLGNKQLDHRRTNARRKRIQEFILQQKVGKACVRCGINDYRVLDFHHPDPNEKQAGIAQLWKLKWSKQRILEEIAKCEVLCANCHRILHWEERNGPLPAPGSAVND